MKKTIQLLGTAAALVTCIWLATGCALFADRIAGKVADAIDDYCKEPLQARDLYRDTVNAELAADGHRIEITCAGDATP